VLSVSCLSGYAGSSTNGVGNCTIYSLANGNPISCASGTCGTTVWASVVLASATSGDVQVPGPLALYTGAGQACLPTFYYNAGTCTACASNCQACMSTGCLAAAGACTTGFVSGSNTYSGVVTAISTTVSTCTTASTATNCWINDIYGTTYTVGTVPTNACAVCIPGYILSIATKTCTACPTNCSNITAPANNLATA